MKIIKWVILIVAVVLLIPFVILGFIFNPERELERFREVFEKTKKEMGII
jgi:uncharacterized membrane protein YvbJ